MDDITLGLTIVLGICSLLFLFGWIAALIHQAKRNRWVWFVLTLIFNITSIIYWIFVLVSPKKKK